MPSVAPIKVPIVGVDMYTKEFNKMVKDARKVGQAVASAGKTLTAAVTLPVLGLGAASLKMSRDLNKSMANVGTLIPGQTERLIEMKKSVMDLAVAAGTTSTVISEGLYETISAFPDEKNPIVKLSIATKTARAGLSTVKEALSFVSAATKGYGDITDEAAQKTADMALMVVRMGQTNFPSLAMSMGRVIPIAATLKVKQEELFGAYAAMTGVTGDAAEVSTQLRAIMAALVKPTTDMEIAIRKLGYQSGSAMLETLGLGGTLNALSGHAGGSTDKMAAMFGRVEALNGALALTGTLSGTLAERTKDMYNASGTMNEAFAEQTSGIDKAGFQYDQMIERVKRLGVQIGDKLLPVVSKFITRIEPFISKISEMSDESLMSGIKIAGLVAAIGPALMVIGNTTVAVSGLVGALGGGGLASALAAVTGPIGWIVGGIAAAAAGIAYFWDELEGLRTAIMEPFKILLNDLAIAWGSLTAGVGGFGETLKPVIEFVGDLIAPLAKIALKIALIPIKGFTIAMRFLAPVIRIVAAALKILVKGIEYGYNWFKDLMTEFLEGTTIGRGLAKVFSFIGDVLGGVWDIVKKVWDTVAGFFDDLADKMEGMGIMLDAATEKQKKYNAAARSGEQGFGVSEAASKTTTEIVNKIQASKGMDAVVRIAFDNLPPGMKPKVKRERGGKVKIKRPKGDIMAEEY